MGEHEPPTNRSFYLSLGASTIRFAIILALVVGGVVVIDQAFQAPGASSSNGSDGGGGNVPGLTGGGPTTTASPQPTAPTGATGTTQPEPSPQVEGVRVAVFNGAGKTGLAGDTMLTFEDQYGYVEAQSPADAPAPYSVTTIYYQGSENKIEAEFLAEDFFAPLEVEAKVKKLQPGTADINQDVQLAIFLGTDYSAASA
jgi:LytR cell envelope-related transcriptional attenuator